VRRHQAASLGQAYRLREVGVSLPASAGFRPAHCHHQQRGDASQRCQGSTHRRAPSGVRLL